MPSHKIGTLGRPELAPIWEIVESLGDIGRIGGQESNPIIPVGTGEDTDLYIREIGNVLYEAGDTGAEYKTWYTGYNSGSATDEKIHYAHSSDGVTWTKEGVVIAQRAEDPYIVKVSGTYYLYAEDKANQGADGKVRRWSFSSPTGTYTDDGQITGAGDDVASPVVWYEDAVWYLFYELWPATPSNVRLATSEDGLAWTNDVSNPVVDSDDLSWETGAIVPDDIVKIGSTYYLFYHAYDDPTFKEGMATSTNLTDWTDSNKNPLVTDEGAIAWISTASYYDDGTKTFLYYSQDGQGIYKGYPQKLRWE